MIRFFSPFRIVTLTVFLSVGGFAQNQPTQQLKSEIAAALESGNVSRAGQLAAQGIQRWPGDPDFVHYRGIAYFRIGKLDLAQQDLLAARQISPADLNIAFDLALLRMAQRNYEGAAREFETALKDPARERSGMAHVLLGRAYQNSNRSELALEQFKAALRVEPTLKLGHYHLGYAYESLGKNKEALAEYEKELERTKDSAELFYQYGHLLLETGENDRALSQLKKALTLDPNHADAQYDLGKTLLLIGKNQESVVALKRAVELSPESPNPYFQLSKALSKTGDRAAAQQALNRFAELKKNQKEAGGMATGRIR